MLGLFSIALCAMQRVAMIILDIDCSKNKGTVPNEPQCPKLPCLAVLSTLTRTVNGNVGHTSVSGGGGGGGGGGGVDCRK